MGGTEVQMSAVLPDLANIVQFAYSGTYDSHRPVLIDAEDPNRFITRHSALQITASLTGAFDEGTTVCICMENDITYAPLLLAIVASRCRWTGVNPAYKAPELEHHLVLSDSSVIVVCSEQLEKVKQAVHGVNREIEIIIWSDILKPQQTTEHLADDLSQGPDQAQYRYLHQLQRPADLPSFYHTIDKVERHAIAALFSTSGTTGLPKMAARTHAALVMESAAAADNHHLKPYTPRRLLSTPIFHSFSTGEMAFNSLRLGHATYYLRRFNPVAFPKAIHDYQINEIFAPPPLVLKLIESPQAHAQIQSLRCVYSGGAAFVPELKSRFDSVYESNQNGPPRISMVYGCSEAGWLTTFKYDDHDTTNSVGRALDGYEIRVAGSEGFKSCEGRTIGELLFRGPGVMKSYLGNPEATIDAFEDGEWLKTGDIGFVAPDGKVYVIDRCKDLIKVNGFQVSPSELENALLRSPDVLDVGVVGAGRDVSEHPVAFILRARSHVTAEEIKLGLVEQLASYKYSKLEVRFIDVLPKSVTGKILRTELRKLCV